MPHFPSSPSPLRNTLDFSAAKADEEEDDRMEIDEVDDTSFEEEYNNEPIETHTEATENAVVEEIEATPEERKSKRRMKAKTKV